MNLSQHRRPHLAEFLAAGTEPFGAAAQARIARTPWSIWCSTAGIPDVTWDSSAGPCISAFAVIARSRPMRNSTRPIPSDRGGRGTRTPQIRQSATRGGNLAHRSAVGTIATRTCLPPAGALLPCPAPRASPLRRRLRSRTLCRPIPSTLAPSLWPMTRRSRRSSPAPPSPNCLAMAPTAAPTMRSPLDITRASTRQSPYANDGPSIGGVGRSYQSGRWSSRGPPPSFADWRSSLFASWAEALPCTGLLAAANRAQEPR